MVAPVLEEADIVIIGAGTAGCVLANRLSASPSLSVLVLEAGEDHSKDPRVFTPARTGELYRDEQLDWAFESEPEPGLLHTPNPSYDNPTAADPGKPGRVMQHPRGKAVGGTSIINSFALINPSAAEIDAWAELGNEGWDWTGTKKYYRKFQTITPPSSSVVDELNLAHNFTSSGGSGPVQASFPLTATPLMKVWLEAFRSLKLENVSDPLDGQALGGGITTNHIGPQNRERSHAGVAYLTPVKDRENLRIVTGALVQKILFGKGSSDSKAVAKSVVYEIAGEAREVRIGKELILAAGVFGTPQLLELSGIGHATLLREQGIEVVYNNPAVGENLQDHIRAGISFESTPAADGGHRPLSREEAEKLYVESRSGPWADMAAWMFAYMPLAGLSSPEDMQQLESTYRKCLKTRDKGISESVRKHYSFMERTLFSSAEASATAYLARKAVTPVPVPGLEAGKIVTLCAMLSHPLSRGSVHLKSPKANEKPAVTFNYYRNPFDLEVHACHMLVLQTLAQNSALAPMSRPNGARWPPQLDLESAKRFLRETATTNYHPCGTCSMLPEKDGGVVDPRLRVYGTANVRVVDASIFPIIPRGNIISTVYAVAEKSADIILQDLGLKAEVKSAKSVTTPVDFAIEIAVHTVNVQMYLSSAPPNTSSLDLWRRSLDGIRVMPRQKHDMTKFHGRRRLLRVTHDSHKAKLRAAKKNINVEQGNQIAWNIRLHQLVVILASHSQPVKMTLRRIRKEWLNLQNDPLPTCSAVPKNEDDMLHWTGTISGPSDTPYRDGVFHLKIRLPEIYPRVSPELTFTTPIFHPNVSTQGDIQLGELDRMQWSPVLTIRTLLISLQALLSDPNLAEGCVLNEEAAKLYLDDPKGFQERARERTVSHAMSGGAGL